MSLCIHRLEKTTIFEKNSYRSWDVSTSVDIDHLEDALDVQVIDPGLLHSKPFVGAKLPYRLCCPSVCFLCMLLIKAYLLFSVTSLYLCINVFRKPNYNWWKPSWKISSDIKENMCSEVKPPVLLGNNDRHTDQPTDGQTWS